MKDQRAIGEIDKSSFRALSLDGGGVRGLYTAVLLRGLTAEFAKQQGLGDTDEFDLGKQFDLIVGTSTGAILAVALAAGVPLSKVIALYTKRAKHIFQSPVPEDNKRGAFAWWVWRHLRRAANDPTALQTALEEAFGNETLGELYQRRGIALCIPAVDAETLKSWGFKTPHLPRLQRDINYRLVDVCMASAAAPLIFPVKRVQCLDRSPASPAAPRVNWFVDGGLWANNPAVVALTEALTTAKPDQRIQLVSVSTCPPFKGTTVNRETANRGLGAWKAGVKMVETSLDAQSFAYDYIAKTLACHAKQPVDYVRLSDPDVGADDIPYLGMDNPSDETLTRLTTLAYRAVDQNRSEATTGDPPPKAVLVDVFANLKPLASEEKQRD
jgi:predicted acylesterase/phospholipase RssA